MESLLAIYCYYNSTLFLHLQLPTTTINVHVITWQWIDNYIYLELSVKKNNYITVLLKNKGVIVRSMFILKQWRYYSLITIIHNQGWTFPVIHVIVVN